MSTVFDAFFCWQIKRLLSFPVRASEEDFDLCSVSFLAITGSILLKLRDVLAKIGPVLVFLLSLTSNYWHLPVVIWINFSDATRILKWRLSVVLHSHALKSSLTNAVLPVSVYERFHYEQHDRLSLFSIELIKSVIPVECLKLAISASALGIIPRISHLTKT